MFAVTSWTAISGKSSTYDEPVHALASWLVLHDGDYRIDPENPPLWQYFAALPNDSNALRIDRADPNFAAILHQNQDLRFAWVVHELYQTAGNDGESFVRNSRRMMLILGLGLGAGRTLELARSAGGSPASSRRRCTRWYPNFLGHAPVVKNDVALALALTWMSLALWSVGKRIAWPGVLSLSCAGLGDHHQIHGDPCTGDCCVDVACAAQSRLSLGHAAHVRSRGAAENSPRQHACC